MFIENESDNACTMPHESTMFELATVIQAAAEERDTLVAELITLFMPLNGEEFDEEGFLTFYMNLFSDLKMDGTLPGLCDY